MRLLCFLFSVVCPVSCLLALNRVEMVQNLDIIRHTLEVGYAPAEWKKEFLGWDLNRAFEDSKQEVLAPGWLTMKNYQQIVRNFLGTLQDYHVGVVFYSTESAFLPFSVQAVQGKFYVDWVDYKRLGRNFYGIGIGDELVGMDDKPLEQALDELRSVSRSGLNPATEEALLAMKITLRMGAAGDRVPQGPVKVSFVSAYDGSPYSYQLIWRYEPEWIDASSSVHSLLPMGISAGSGGEEEQPLMMHPIHHIFASHPAAARPGCLGARKSYLPPLGEIVWSIDDLQGFQRLNGSDSEGSSFEDISFWYAYIYLNPNGRRIGYIRIPHYGASQQESEQFGELMNFLEQRTDALVIDQLNNPGGYVKFEYDLSSMLAVEPLVTPKHRIKITQREVARSYRSLSYINELLQDFEEEIDQSSNGVFHTDADDNWEDLNYQRLLFMKNYHEFILQEWSRGHFLTDPIHIEGIDLINPHPVFRYRKPLLVLINELDFSGADFFPCTLQDNKRAVLFGAKTAGAGGCVGSAFFPNRCGIAGIFYTGSIADRPGGEKLENLGVTPDVHYEMTKEDLFSGYKGYVDAVNQTLEGMLLCD